MLSYANQLLAVAVTTNHKHNRGIDLLTELSERKQTAFYNTSNSNWDQGCDSLALLSNVQWLH